MQQHGPEQLSDGQTERLESIRRQISKYFEDGYDHLALSLCDESLNDIESGTPLEGAVRTERADLLLDLDRPEDALSDVERARHTGWKTVDLFAIGGWAEYALDAPDDSRWYFDRALEIDSEDIPALIGRSFVLQQLESYERAISDLSYAINHESDNAQLYAFRAEMHLDADDLDKAESDILEAIDRDVADSPYHLDLARIQLARNETDKAYETVKKTDFSAESDIGFEFALLGSHLAVLKEDLSEAKKLAIQGANFHPDEAFAFVQLARVGLREEEPAWAHRMAERAVELDPSLPDGYLARAATLKALGRDDKAEEDWECGHRAEIELPFFLLDYCYGYSGGERLEDEILVEFEKPFYTTTSDTSESTDATSDESNQTQSPFEAAFGEEGAQDWQSDPANMLGYAFDESGEIKPQFKPMLEMIVQNAPNIIENMPSGLVQQLGGVDPDKLKQTDLSDLSSEELEERLKRLYQMLQD